VPEARLSRWWAADGDVKLRKLLECFANGRSVNIIFDPAKKLIDDGNDNKELTQNRMAEILVLFESVINS